MKKCRACGSIKEDIFFGVRLVNGKKYLVSECDSCKASRERIRRAEKALTRPSKQRSAVGQVEYSRQLRNVLRGACRKFILTGKSDWAESIIGADLYHVKLHIEKHFQPGMYWCNSEDWQIDHHIPLCYFDTNSSFSVKCAFNWRNLRPLWNWQNYRKHTSMPDDWKEFLQNLQHGVVDDHHKFMA